MTTVKGGEAGDFDENKYPWQFFFFSNNLQSFVG